MFAKRPRRKKTSRTVAHAEPSPRHAINHAHRRDEDKIIVETRNGAFHEIRNLPAGLRVEVHAIGDE